MAGHLRASFIVLIPILAATAAAPPQSTPAALLVEIQRRLHSDLDPLGAPVAANERAALMALYADGAPPLWIDWAGRPARAATDALALLARAASHGLEPLDYRIEQWLALHEAITGGGPLEASAMLEVGLSFGMLRYLRDVHRGRIDPRTVGFRLDAPDTDVDLAITFRRQVANDRLNAFAESLAPQFDQYARLRRALAAYRAVADCGLPDLALPRRVIRAGDRLPPGLVEWLGAWGDRDVASFQRRHGLVPDGVIGAKTRAALSVPIGDRIRQIELAMERLRWLPPLGDGPVIALNVPMFRLWGWDATPSSAAAIRMNAIVGQAMKTETPIFVGEMRTVVFRPYWNVPPSILKKELLPLIARDPRYIEREDFEIVRGLGAAVKVLPVTPASIRALRNGTARLRQRPGARNPLGPIEFLFPNAANVYLHGTPMPELFARTRRDFSHGCIRVEDPMALADWVLQGQDEWTCDSIAAAAAGPDTVRVDLVRPVRVVIFYMTAAVVPEDGTVHFAVDIYGHDETLNRALQTVRMQRTRRYAVASIARKD